MSTLYLQVNLLYSRIMSKQELQYWNAWNQIQIIGPKRFKKLDSGFSSMEKAWQASKNELEKIGLTHNIVEKIIKQRRTINPEKAWLDLEKHNIKTITIGHKQYPKNLKNIYDPPAMLYIKGALEQVDDLAIGIVGTRKMSSYGKQVAHDLSFDLARAGMTIVSGLAQGIDTIAHKSALKANARTIAVLGSGLAPSQTFPRENYNLAREISKNGAVISEFPLYMPPLAHNFPIRNRIISGLSRAILVIEAAQKSGAIITANQALDQGKDVFAIPGSIYSPVSKGTNDLIKAGAKLVTNSNDVLEELNLEQIKSYAESRKIIPENPNQEKILHILSSEPIHVNLIIKQTNLSASKISSELSIMEMQGKVRDLGSGMYVIGK
ncbi:DNA-protecting protein DprA [bacterium]|nr:DNA-protecting protein DprA [bacterium]